MTRQRTNPRSLNGQFGVLEQPVRREHARLQWRAPADWVVIDPPVRPDTLIALRRVFGEMPCTLAEEHLPELRAMAVVGGAHYGRLAKLVEERGAIEVSIQEEGIDDAQ